MKHKCLRIALSVLLLLTALTAADEPSTSTALIRAEERRPAPNFALKDSSGETATLTNYAGRILVLDFWATWCTGCKQEIPWFTEYQKKYGGSGLSIVGVAMDDGGWKVVKPFLSEHPVPYRMVLGDDETAKQYRIRNLPDTFLIDRHGRIAAVYQARLVDRDELEASIKKLVSEILK
jgi:peroxiredoxin